MGTDLAQTGARIVTGRGSRKDKEKFKCIYMEGGIHVWAGFCGIPVFGIG